jgi:hypothetical protein
MALPKVYRAANESLNNPIAPASYVPGSQPIRNRVFERYCRYRAEGLPKIEAYREAQRFAYRRRGNVMSDKDAADTARRLEFRQEITERIQYLTSDVLSAISAKRKRLEERLWSIHEADIGNYIETVTINGKTVERTKLLSDIDPEHRKNIEKIAFTGNGRIVPILHSSLEANKELRKLLDIGRRDDLAGARLSDAELIQQLADQAKELGVEIKLDYSFAQRPPDSETGGNDAQVIDNVEGGAGKS